MGGDLRFQQPIVYCHLLVDMVRDVSAACLVGGQFAGVAEDLIFQFVYEPAASGLDVSGEVLILSML